MKTYMVDPNNTKPSNFVHDAAVLRVLRAKMGGRAFTEDAAFSALSDTTVSATNLGIIIRRLVKLKYLLEIK